MIYFARDVNKRWDMMLDEREKREYIAHNKAASALNICHTMVGKIDEVRGHGSELAYQLF